MTRVLLLCAALGFAAGAVQAQTQSQASETLRSRSLAATCANCHSTQGNAKGSMPSLAGRKEDELLKLLSDFRSGARPATVMHQIAKGYTEDQLRLVAKHFAALPAAKR
ncbi:cytochrome C [Pelomonas sp. SE-A7]|uniref:c-type cytochrome n=1 Tax=Pelomonas sp. SE-A7 TaxID=3054953 RepID=UPI00259CDC05|nr:cytochrome C [Pelomonas sp. SE-A7]MDM4765641.1 cytochrome C [Pelomonas sp. SE-A7]